MQSNLTTRVPVIRIRGDSVKQDHDKVVSEVPVTVFLNNQEFVTMVCSPFAIDALVAGFLLVEGIVENREDLVNIKVLPGEGLVWVETAQSRPAESLFLKRCLASCCGRGRSTFYFMNDAGLKPVDSGFTVTSVQIKVLNERRESLGSVFKSTGGTHGAGLCTAQEILYFHEDIGRHNAVDKALGSAFLEGISFNDKAVILSGRISSEMIVKVARAGIPLIISRSAPTGLALNMAESLNITTVGFVRQDRLNIYTHPERIVIDN
ncbi:MAG: formate dehydrogenase accessory sulfurtransferase FdhD [Bacillota bacterium]